MPEKKSNIINIMFIFPTLMLPFGDVRGPLALPNGNSDGAADRMEKFPVN
jgi:hypothetical protein